MPAAKPSEFRCRALDLVRQGDQPAAKIAKDLGISESCLRRWMDQDDVDAGHKEGLIFRLVQELVGDVKCVAYQGAHSMDRSRVIDYYCDRQNTQVLRGIKDDSSPWMATMLTTGADSRKKRAQVPVLTAWYGDSRQAYASPQKAISNSDVRTALQTFGRAWVADDKATLRRYAEAETVNGLDGWSSPSRPQVNWRAGCGVDKSGEGDCGLSMIIPEGGGFTYVLHYEAALGNTVHITWVETLGGGA